MKQPVLRHSTAFSRTGAAGSHGYVIIVRFVQPDKYADTGCDGLPCIQ